MNKRLVGILAAALIAGSLAGCGASDEGKALKDIKVDKYVTLGEYKGVEVAVAPASVDEAQLSELVDRVYNGSITIENGGFTDRAVENGDTVNIDYEGKKDGVAFDGGTASGAALTIGSGQFIDGFEEGLIGVMPGETVDLPLTFPAAYQSAELAGQDVVFTVTVNFIIPAKSDETVAAIEIEGVTTEDGLNQYVYDYLYAQAESTYNSTLQGSVLEKIMENCTFEEMPGSMVADYEEQMRAGITQNAESVGVDVDTFTQYYYGADYETFVTNYAKEALRQDMVMQAIANQENLNMTDEELNAQLLEYATGAGYTTVEEYVGENDIEMYRIELVNQKVLQFLTDNAVITEA